MSKFLKDIARAIGGRNKSRDEFGNTFEITFDSGTLFGCELGNGFVEVRLTGSRTLLQGDFARRRVNRDGLFVVGPSEDSCEK